MADFVALHWDPAKEISARIGWITRTLAKEPGWRLAIDEPGRLVALSTPRNLNLRPLPGGRLLLGDVHTRAAEGLRLAADADFETLCRDLSRQAWGGYVVIDAPAAGAAAVFRAPMGDLEAVICGRKGVQVVASCAPDWLLVGLAPVLAIDWSILREQLVSPGRLAGPLGLIGAYAVPGGVLDWPDGRNLAIWTPQDAASGSVRDDVTLPQLVETCIGQMTMGRRVLVETSGGFDSAVVAAALGRGRGAREAILLNYHTLEAEGDERAFARRVAQAAGLPLIERRKPQVTLDEPSLAAVSSGWRPGVWGLDSGYDGDVAEQCQAWGAEVFLTGKGGDTVFYQMPSALIAVDHLRASGLAGMAGPVLPDLARWTRRSVWSLLATALRANLSAGAGAGAGAGAWDRRRPAPAKRLQVEGVGQSLAFAGPSRRAAAADFRHPLLSRPIVEHCLRLPAAELTRGGRDRAYARTAFSAWLAPEVAQRHGKGDATAHFGRALAGRLDFLRPYLLDGELAQARVLDRRRLEAQLTSEHLMWAGGAGQILHAVIIEAWARSWTRRLRGLG
jgi:asparagine synthase (glutamine-hydrolysing)